MSAPSKTVELSTEAALYQEIQHFYARQMRLLDESRVQEWADTFTEDGVFAANAHPAPQSGRAEIVEGARRASQLLADQKVQRRHWLGMLEVREAEEGTLTAHTYALVINTPQGGRPTVEFSTSCDDVLTRENGTLQVRSRQVYRDDLPRG